MTKLLEWDIYEIITKSTSVNGVMLRGRIRKFGLSCKQNILTENTEDTDNGVRFAVLSGDDVSKISNYLKNVIPDASIKKVKESVSNPVLSKLKVNQEERYTL